MNSALAPLTATLVALDARFTQTSLELPDQLRFNVWQRLGDQLDELGNANQWHRADWAAYGEDRYRRDYGAALEQLARKSLLNLAYIARKVEPSRRREDLSFSHHAEVAALSPIEQTAFLNDAAEKSWTRDELREEISRYRNADRPARQPALTVRAIGELHDLCARAAEHAHMAAADWAVSALERAARQELEAA